MTDDVIHRAVEITKVAVGNPNAAWIGQPDKVAQFLETVAEQIEQLKAQK